MTPEQLITSLEFQVLSLKQDLEQAQQDIKDFERAAIEWRKGYSDMEKNLRVKLHHAEQTISELRSELFEARRLVQS